MHAVPYRAVIRTCSRLYTDTDIYVVGAMPRPDDEENITQHVKHANKCMMKICKELQKFEHISVTYIGACRIFLENFCHYDEISHGLTTKTCIIRPVPKFFQGFTPALNEVGADRLYNYLLQCAGKAFDGSVSHSYCLCTLLPSYTAY